MSWKVKFGDKAADRLLIDIARQYTPIAALREPSTNSIDAYAAMGRLRKGRRNPIYVVYDGKSRQIAVVDCATGILKTIFDKLPVAMGQSEKYGEPDLRGEKALGLLAYGAVDDHLHLFTKTPELVNLVRGLHFHIDRTKSAMLWDNCDTDVKTIEDMIGFKWDQGTINLFKFSKDNRRHLQPAEMKRELSWMYWPLIEEESVVFNVGTKGKEFEEVKAPEIEGKELMDTIIRKGGAHFKVHLWLHPERADGKVGVYSKGVRVYREIGSSRKGASIFDDERLQSCLLYTSGVTTGFIDDRNLHLTLGREGIRPDSTEYHAFIDQLVKLNDSFWPRIVKRIQRAKDRMLTDAISFAYENVVTSYRTPIAERYGGMVSKRKERKFKDVVRNFKDRVTGAKKKEKMSTAERAARRLFLEPKCFVFDSDSKDFTFKLDYRGEQPEVHINSNHYRYSAKYSMGRRVFQEYVLLQFCKGIATYEAEKMGMKVRRGSPYVSSRADELFEKIINKSS